MWEWWIRRASFDKFGQLKGVAFLLIIIFEPVTSLRTSEARLDKGRASLVYE
jgi:hypothetical protein